MLRNPNSGACPSSVAAPGDRCPHATDREQHTTGGLYSTGICEISASIDLRREGKDGNSLTSRLSRPKRNAPALCSGAGSAANDYWREGGSPSRPARPATVAMELRSCRRLYRCLGCQNRPKSQLATLSLTSRMQRPTGRTYTWTIRGYGLAKAMVDLQPRWGIKRK